ncbi:uncharacterized protein [Montipora capricornis]|uniref:uncharacterized protein isoform X3 n=1 Tax=Montipora capricornis TaxID=246305 RepID=UPI0035F1EBF2
MGEFAARHEVYSKTSLPSGGTGYDAAISPEAGMRGKERRGTTRLALIITQMIMTSCMASWDTYSTTEAFLQCCTKLQNTVDS